MRKILAISGGIDSVVMLHMMRRDPEIIVAHLNHGIRDNSDQDEIFVKKLAKNYDLPFESKKELLGENCSEALARERRYAFLNQLCEKHNAEIYTAHHKNDLIESIIINLHRGTGWRGLTPLDDPKIHRPLIDMTKKEIYSYAAKNGLVFRQDPTNTSDAYLRNRIRNVVTFLPLQTLEKIADLSKNQKKLKSEIDEILKSFLPIDNIYQRSWFENLDDDIAMEFLRAGLAKVNLTATRPQLKNFLNAIRTYPPKKRFNLPNDHLVTIEKQSFRLE